MEDPPMRIIGPPEYKPDVTCLHGPPWRTNPEWPTPRHFDYRTPGGSVKPNSDAPNAGTE
jgi:hypothetical protein